MKFCYSLKALFLCFLFSLKMSSLASNQTLSTEDARVLYPLIRLMTENAEFGYVLYDKKPVCILSYHQVPMFFDEVDFIDKLSTAIFCAKEIVEHPALKSENILFHYDETGGLLLIINRRLFLDIVHKNLSFFQYILGPKITPEILLETLISSSKSFFETLNYNRVLMGILLGFGVQNAIFHSRYENLRYDLQCVEDLPPYSPNFLLCQDKMSEDAFLFTEKEENRFLPNSKSNHKPSLGFNSLQEEAQWLDEKDVMPSEKLSKGNPPYLFGDFGFDPAFIQNLEETQTKIQQFLQQPDWFEKTLEMICQEKVVVPSFEVKPFNLPPCDANLIFAKSLRQEQIGRGYDSAYFSSFAEGLLNPNDPHIPKWKISIFPRYYQHLHAAKINLEESDRFFATLDQDPEYTTLLKGYLYYKVLQEGQGLEKGSKIKVNVDLDIYDSLGNSLNSSRNIDLNLSEIIPGFSHGLKNIKKGEKRLIYIHPALAYGVHTYLERGAYLKAIITMNKMEKDESSLPELKPIDLAFVKSDAFFQICEEEYKKTLNFQGRMKGHFLNQLPGIDVKMISKYFLQLKDDVELSSQEREYLHRFLWNVYFTQSE